MPYRCSAASQAAPASNTHSEIVQLPLTMLMQEKNHFQNCQKDMRYSKKPLGCLAVSIVDPPSFQSSLPLSLFFFPLSSSLPHSLSQLTWPVSIDQVALLQLLSSHATQEFRYEGTSRVDFVGADGEPLIAYDDEITAVSGNHYLLSHYCWYTLSCAHARTHTHTHTHTHQLKSRTEYLLNGEPEKFPILDFVPHDSKFGFEMGKTCFCNELL